MGNLNGIKIFIRRYAVTKNKRDAESLILSLSYNLPSLNVYMLLSKEERNVIKDACNILKQKEVKKII